MLPSHQEATLGKVLINEWSPRYDAFTLRKVQNITCSHIKYVFKFNNTLEVPLPYNLNVTADPGCLETFSVLDQTSSLQISLVKSF